MSATYVPMRDAGRMAYETVQTTREILREWNFWQWNVLLFEGFHGWAGQAEAVTRTIAFSVPFMILNPETTWNTMAHELAHAAVGCARHGHDDVWRDVFLALGGNGHQFTQHVPLPEQSDGPMHTNYGRLLTIR
jgi:hypothetical protein